MDAISCHYEALLIDEINAHDPIHRLVAGWFLVPLSKIANHQLPILTHRCIKSSQGGNCNAPYEVFMIFDWRVLLCSGIYIPKPHV